MKICDMHTHSYNSFDADNSVEEICTSAIEKGLFAIAITDHCEAQFIPCGENCEFGSFDKRIPKSVNETLEAKQKYAGRLRVLCGIELGQPMHDMESTKKALSYGDFDFTLASVHNMRGEEDFYYFDFTGKDIDEVLSMYFAELAETAGFEHFDSLAHITYPLRYIKTKLGFVPDITKHQNELDKVYKILIQNNKALEINVSGLFKELGSTLPDEQQIKRFKELGGKYITIGTDAHKAVDVGRGVEQGIAVVKRCGFDSYTIYENHKPIMIEID